MATLLAASVVATCASVNVAVAACSFDFEAWKRKPEIGVNIAGPAFGSDVLPGKYGTNFIYPEAKSLDYWQKHGVRLVRLMFQWERMQPKVAGGLAEGELARLRAFLAAADARSIKVIVGPHNYGRYTLGGTATLIGSEAVPTTAFADFWRKLSVALKDAPAIFGYSLMNEPHDMEGTWKATAQAALDAIRSVDPNRLVLVPGDDWSSALRWAKSNEDLLLDDPSKCLMYDAHQYFDHDGSGAYKSDYASEGGTPDLGANRIGPFLDWLERHGQVGIITEFGVPQGEPSWFVTLDNFLAKAKRAGVGGTYWAAGPWWGDYPLSIEPKDGKDAPAMAVLSKHVRQD